MPVIGVAREHRGALRLFAAWALMTLPLAAWFVYVWLNVADPRILGAGNVSLPFVSLSMKVLAAGNTWWEAVRAGDPLVRKTFELLAPASLVVQAVYLVRYPRLSSRAWRFGVGFAALLLLIGDAVWVEQYAFCRTLLPLTAAFNLLVHRHEEGASYTRWFLAGNLGMIWMVLKLLRVG